MTPAGQDLFSSSHPTPVVRRLAPHGILVAFDAFLLFLRHLSCRRLQDTWQTFARNLQGRRLHDACLGDVSKKHVLETSLGDVFISDFHFFQPNSFPNIFIGHHEPYTELVIRRLATKFKVALYGTRWLKLRNMAYVYPKTVWGDEYYRALISAKMGICIYSRHNLNTNQLRPYELAYAGTFILAERSKDLVADFQDGVHCACFASPDELLTKAEQYLHNDGERLLISKAAKKRVDELFIDKVFGETVKRVSDILSSNKQ